MDRKRVNINFNTTFDDVKDLNPNFASGKMRIAYTGRNRNKSDISKDVFEAAIPTMFNCPIVARYDRNTDSFGSHDVEVVINDNTLKVVNATTPLGIVPSGANWYWEQVKEDDESVHEYLVSDILLWKRQEAFDHLRQVKNVAQSMECEFEEYHCDNDGYCVADKMCFSAFCLLESAEPCFEGANVQIFTDDSYASFKNEFAQMLSDLKEVTNITDTDNSALKEGGKDNLKFSEEVKDKILSEFNATMADIDFEITEDMTEEDFRKAVEAKFDSNEHPVVPNKVEKFSATYEQKREAIQNALDPKITRDENGEVVSSVSYWICDFDDTYAYVNQYTYTDSDRQEENGRLSYSFDEEAMTATISGEFEKMIVKWLTVAENQQIEDSRKEFESLKEFKRTRLEADHKIAVDEVLSDFADIAETDEYKTLAESVYSIDDLDEIKTKCYAIRGKYAPVKTEKKEFSKKAIKVEFEHTQTSTNRYGDLFSKANK